MTDDLKPHELIANIQPRPPQPGGMNTPAVIRKGMFCYASNPKSVEILKLPNARGWNPLEEDWKLPKNWKEIVFEGLRQRLDRFRTFKLFMDICVRCGACADKCPFFLGTGDPQNMPVARADLLRKVYKRYFTLGGKVWGRGNEAEELNEAVLGEWFTYFYQCSECRRCSVFCPYGIDTAELTMAAREIMAAAGIATKYVTEVVATGYDTGI